VLKDALRAARVRAYCHAWRGLGWAGIDAAPKAPVSFVIENADWAIRWVGEHIRDEINRLSPDTAAVTTRPERLLDRVVHFGSQYMWLSWGPAMSGANRYVTSFFHGKPEDGPDVARHIDEFLASVPRLSRIVTANRIVEQRLLDWGVPREKVARIPIGVDTALFTPPSPEQRMTAREALGIAGHHVVVGSFQKDGVGWQDGLEPKLIKGPDVFLDTVARLNRDLPVFVLLTGPARGYVKAGLAAHGIPHAHRYVPTHEDLVACYHALDLYLITSREEGGPMGLMESMASGVPVVSTAVGMAPDLIEHGVTGGLAESEAVEALADACRALLDDAGGGVALRAAAREAVMVCDWKIVGRDHLELVYAPLMR